MSGSARMCSGIEFPSAGLACELSVSMGNRKWVAAKVALECRDFVLQLHLSHVQWKLLLVSAKKTEC